MDSPIALELPAVILPPAFVPPAIPVPEPLPEWFEPTPMPELPVTPRPEPFLEVAPRFEGSTGGTAISPRTVNMQGNPFPNALANNGFDGWSHHNLNGQFSELTGIIGRIDGSGSNNSVISFIGDGVTLAASNVDGDTTPIDVNIDVQGVQILRIQLDTILHHSARANIAFANAMIK